MDTNSKTPRGDITTLLDLTPRDEQDAEFTPLDTERTWWQPDTERRLHPFTMSLQNFPLRGPAAWGQRVTFDLGSVSCGDILLGTVLQLQLSHWFPPAIVQGFLNQTLATQYKNLGDSWHYANSIGSILVARAELEIGDTTIEIIDSDSISIVSALWPSLNTITGIATDGYGRVPSIYLQGTSATRVPTRFQPANIPSEEFWAPRPFPTQDGTVLVPLPFFFSRVRLQEGLPLLSIREGDARIHITFRDFHDCVRQLRGYRDACDSTPLGSQLPLYDISPENPISFPVAPAQAITVPPPFQTVQLLTYAANVHGSVRQALLRQPHEILFRELRAFHFAEPLSYTVSARTADTIAVQLPLDLNHPVEELVWFVRRKAVSINNEWTNFGSVLARDIDPVFNPQTPLLHSAKIQINGVDIVEGDEAWFRRHIAEAHKGGALAYESYIYGYSFSKMPGAHQPNGTVNMSRTSSVRLLLDVRPPTALHGETMEWEVKVFVIGCQWLRFQNGIANRMFMS